MNRGAGVAIFLLAGVSLSGQIDPTRAQLAALREDVALLRQEVARLRLDVEAVTRENERLRNATVTPEDLAALRRSFAAADASNRSEIVAMVSQKLEALAARTEKALKALAEASATVPSLPETVSFTNDYPREGVAYTVESGDTLSEIARKMDSTVKDIQNANRIADPSKLQVGQTLFIPQRSR